MKIGHLLLLVAGLSLCIWLALTNPTMDAYLGFVEAELGKALDRSESAKSGKEGEMLRAIFRNHSHELVGSLVQPNTVRRNWGLFSWFETSVRENRIEVIGIGGTFIPVKGVDEAILHLGRLAF
jgi:hypothetical protein